VTWTFNEASITTNLARVRVAIGDTNVNDQVLSDEIINAYLSDNGSDIRATSIACIREGILPRFARKTDRSNLGISTTRSQLFQHYTDLLKMLESAAGSTAAIFCGGISEVAKDAINSDADTVAPMFYRGQDDNR
jgi:hypothetical protein